MTGDGSRDAMKLITVPSAFSASAWLIPLLERMQSRRLFISPAFLDFIRCPFISGMLVPILPQFEQPKSCCRVTKVISDDQKAVGVD